MRNNNSRHRPQLNTNLNYWKQNDNHKKINSGYDVKRKAASDESFFRRTLLEIRCEQTEEQKKITSTIFFSRERSTNMVNIGLWLGVFLHNCFTWTNLAKGLHICSCTITGVQRAVDVALLGKFFRCLHTFTYNFATELDFRHSYAFWKIFKQC